MYSHENTPKGFNPCTRKDGHEGPCALSYEDPFPCPDCTKYMMACGSGGWYATKYFLGFIPIGKEWVECDTCEGTGFLPID